MFVGAVEVRFIELGNVGDTTSFVAESVTMIDVNRAQRLLILGLILVLLIPSFVKADYPRLYGHHKDRIPPRSYFYPDKYDYGFDPVPPNFKIAPGFRPNHSWKIGGWYYGQGDYSPGYDSIIWFGYEIEY